jgi:ERCC4-type nuclease
MASIQPYNVWTGGVFFTRRIRMSISALMVDSREPTWVQDLTFGNIPKTVTFLEQGDAMGACEDGSMILVERKTPSDFLNSLRDERVFLQLANMLLVTRWSYLVITGEFQRGASGKVIVDRGETGWSWNAVQGALLTAQEMGIYVTFCGSDQDYESTVLRLGNRDHKAIKDIGPSKQPRILSINEGIVASLPGIGIERLHQVMEYCGTAGWALCALTDKASKIPGVQEGVKRRIRSALGLSDAQQLGIVTNDLGDEMLQIVPFGNQ